MIQVNINLALECVVDTHRWCLLVDPKSDDIFSVSDWFYAFSIEFSILVVAVWYIMWSNIGQIDANSVKSMDLVPSNSMQSLDKTDGHKEAMVLYADCSNSTKGMFFGQILLVFTVIGCIVVIVMMDECNQNTFIQISLIFECLIFSIIIAASIGLYSNIVKLDVNPQAISLLDDMLLIVCLPSFFLFGILQLSAAVYQDSADHSHHTTTTRALTFLKIILYLGQV